MPERSALARLLQAVVLVLGLAAVAWLAWHGPGWVGWIGAVAIVFSYALILALEFLLSLIIATAPRPAIPDVFRAWVAEVKEVPRVFGWRQAWRWRALDDWLPAESQGRRGVVLIHGFICNRGFWNPWLEQLRARGHAHVAVNLEPVFSSIDAYVPIIEAAVARVEQATGLPPVLVCHSMGGLAARSWLRSAQAAGRVHHLVTLGTPHGGTWLARFSFTPNSRQMRLASSWLQELEQDEAVQAQVPMTCWYAECDNIVFPVASATRPVADNRLVRGAAHVDLAFHPSVMKAVLDQL
jgi:pimeloyl-ACP methyl ester carboxylesterase